MPDETLGGDDSKGTLLLVFQLTQALVRNSGGWAGEGADELWYEVTIKRRK